jgi:cyclopropane fatty-acyl-phospholipid synthase-like methyltransferase
MEIEEKKYWESFYAKNRYFEKPSPFGEFILPFLQADKHLLELGCGNARDSFFFIKNRNLKITALDQCSEEIDFLNEKKDQLDINFIAHDFTNFVKENSFNYIYSRFTLHSVSVKDEKRTFYNAYKSLVDNGLFFIEVRSIKDDLYGEGTALGDHQFITDHYRRFIVMDDMIRNAEESGFSILYKLQSKGLAPYKTRDPEVIRLICQKTG